MHADEKHMLCSLIHPRLSACVCGCLLLFATAQTTSAETRRYETQHYIIRTDVDPELADDLSHRMDTMYEEYASRLGQFLPEGWSKKLEVRIFANEKD